MPKASAPNAPCVLVWLSPHTIVPPGWVRPNSGPTMCTMPRFGSFSASSSMPNSAQFFSSCSIWRAAEASRIGTPPKI